MQTTKPFASSLDDPSRINQLRSLIKHKPSLYRFYAEVYQAYQDCLTRSCQDGIALELGSGASFAKEFIPELVTSDLIGYPGVDRVEDATHLSFATNSLKAIFMMNVLHHIPDCEKFFNEAVRCLKPGGRIFIFDQYLSAMSWFIFRFLHHEPLNLHQTDWRFNSSGPLSDANGAMANIIFERDRAKFDQLYQNQLKVVNYQPHSPLRYWLTGGLKSWSLLPIKFFPLATQVDRWLAKPSKLFCSFVNIEIVRL